MAMTAEERAERQRRAEAIGAEPLRIITLNDPDHEVLRQHARPVRHVNRRVQQLLDQLAVTMYQADGVGLAAPQVGVDLRAFVVDTGEGLKWFVNPEIITAEGEESAYEGCLSIPGRLGEVARATRIRVRALDREGHEFWLDAEDFVARAIQHESDHLDGVLFVDRAQRVVETQPETRLRVVYLGSPAFARDVLGRLLEADVVPLAVVTRGDKPRGRGQRPRPTPVKELAVEAEIAVLHTPDVEALRAEEPDVLVTVAYGRILRPEVLALPRLGAINLHPSLLPRYRGPAPMLRALWDGLETTGVTTMHMTGEVDAGDVILQEEVLIAPEDDRLALEERLAEAGTRLVLRTLRLLARGEAPRQAQDPAGVTYAPALSPGEERIDWTRPTRFLHGQVRALAPRPGATTGFRGELLKLLAARPFDAAPTGEPGRVVALCAGEGFVVRTGDGALLVTAVQPAGKRPMAAGDFLNGHKPAVGEVLGVPSGTPSTSGT